MKQILRSIVLSACGMVFVGCGSLHVNKTVGLPGLPPVDASKVTVVENWADVNRNYQVVGKGTLYRNAGGVTKGSAIKQLRQMAADMGADGVVGLHEAVGVRSAMFVKWREANEPVSPVSLPFAVGLFSMERGPNPKGNQAVMSEATHGCLAYLLERKGYYMMPVLITNWSSGIDGAMNSDRATRETIGGKDVHLLLEIKTLKHSELNAVVVNRAATAIQARILDKQTGKIVHEGTGEGVGYGQMPGSLLEEFFSPDTKRLQATGAAVRQAIAGVQTISP